MSSASFAAFRPRTLQRLPWRQSVRYLAVLGMLAACGGGGDTTAGPGPVTRVSVSVGNVTLTSIGGTQEVIGTAKDANGTAVTSATIVWSSDNTAIASVASSGNSATITARGPGATVIRARVGTIGADIPVQVLGVRAIQVSPSNASIRTGDTQPFSATFDADPGVSTAVTWATENATVATVSATGLVTGVSAGSTVIRATSVADPRFSASGNITVTPSRGVVVSPGTANIATSENRTLVATVIIEAGLSTAVTWRTSAPAVATVSATGVVRGVAFGTTTITAVALADTTLKGTAIINVVPVIRSVTVSPATASLFINGTQQLASTVTAEGTLATTVNWSSANTSVATVNASGLVTAVSLGSTTITATSTVDATKSGVAAITVAPRPIAVTIAQRVVGLNPGTSITLNAAVSADPGISTAVTWSSSTASVATVTQAGLVSAIAAGSTLITATSQADNTKKDTVTVTVVPRLAASWASSRLNGLLYDDLVSVAAFGPVSAFAINSINGGASGGDIYGYNGTTWSLSASGSTFGTRFLSVHGSASDNAIAVGTNGVIVRWNGTAWAAVTSGSTRTLRSVWVESGTKATAVGDNGTALRWNGTAWSALTTGSTQQLNGVWSVGSSTIMVGNAGEVLKYNGTTVQRQTVPFSDDLYAVSGLPSGIVTAVGKFGGILRFDGLDWSLIDSNGILDDFYSVSGTDANGGRMYVGGQNGVYQVDGITLTSSSADYPVSVFGISVDPVGTTWTVGQRGSIQRITGATWTTMNFAPDLLDVWTTAANNAWAVGEYGFIYRWNGSAWTRQPSPSLANLYSVWAPSASDAFAGGDNGTMLRWNGSVWVPMSIPSTARIFAIWGSSATNVFAVTDIGEILRFNGTLWTLQATAPGGATLLSVYGVSASEAYATGTGGLVMRFNGINWTAMTAPDAVTTLFGIWMSGGTNIVSVGADADGLLGSAFGYNGTTWSPYSIGPAKALTSVWGPSVFDLYATGDAGTILRYNGVTWQSMATGTPDLLWAMSGAPDASGGAFAVGYNTTIVAGTPASAFTASAVRRPALHGSLQPSLAARLDPKASGAAARGAARKNRMALATMSAASRTNSRRRK
ncbi:MAG: Ig domain-containing protein [Gemmatimonadaceae bacterium]|nr:Ig domain-containing protein [Gemmatimonadaceae bacterium]